MGRWWRPESPPRARVCLRGCRRPCEIHLSGNSTGGQGRRVRLCAMPSQQPGVQLSRRKSKRCAGWWSELQRLAPISCARAWPCRESRMQSQFDLMGAFVPTIAAWLVLLLAVFVPVDAVLTRRGFYRLFWHAPLARFALFVCLFCGSALVVTNHCSEIPMQAVVRVLLTLILLIAAGLLSYDLARYYLYSPWTRDARVRANVVTGAPDVSGYVDDIRVRNNQSVRKGD